MATTTSTAPNPNPVRPAAGPPPGAGSINTMVDPVRLLKQYLWWLVGAGVVGIVLGVAVFFALRMWVPRYTATAVFQANSALSGSDDPGNDAGDENEMQMFMYTQVAVMLDENLLTEAARIPALRTETQWGKQFISASTGNFDDRTAAIELADVVSARVIPDTLFITLSATTGNKNDAATIANTVATAYMERLRRETSATFTEQRESLTRQIQRADSERQALEQRARNLLGDNTIASLEGRQSSSQAEIGTLSPTLVQYNTELQSTRDRLRQYETDLAAPGGVRYPDFLRTEVKNDPIVARHEANISSLNTQLRALLEEFGSNHIAVKRVQQQIAAAEIERDKDMERLLAERFSALISLTRQAAQDYSIRINETTELLRSATARANELTILLAEYNTIKGDAERRAAERAEYEGRLREVESIIDRQASARMTLRYRATVPDQVSFPKIILVVPVVTFLVLFLTSGVILLREVLEQRVRTPADVAAIPRTRVLGVLSDVAEDPSSPASLETAIKDKPDGIVAEQLRQLRSSLVKKVGRGAVLFASGLPGSGTTSIIAGVARSCAAIDEKALVIDANMRRPRLHKAFGAQEGPGLGDVLAGAATLDNAVQPGGSPGVFVLSAGTAPNRVYERLNSDAMSRLIEEAKSKYSLVLIDAPPMTVSGDAQVLANRVDATVLVARAFGETRGLLGRLRNQLGDCKGEFLGVVVNSVKSSAGGYFRKNIRLSHQYSSGAASSGGKRKS